MNMLHLAKVRDEAASVLSLDFHPSKTAYSAKPCVRENYVGKGIEPYINYENTDCSLEDYYKLSPSKTIQMNGWKIPDNYSWKY